MLISMMHQCTMLTLPAPWKLMSAAKLVISLQEDGKEDVVDFVVSFANPI
jgi:hypothetical protein